MTGLLRAIAASAVERSPERNERNRIVSPDKYDYMFKGGSKLGFALKEFSIDVEGKTIADLGCNVGGFTDCLFKHGVSKVYAVDTGYGILAWNLRNDKRVEVFERTNAMHFEPPEKVDGVVIDVGWTRQDKIIPQAFSMVKNEGFILSLFKPQYEAEKKELIKGIVPDGKVEDILQRVISNLEAQGFSILDSVRSNIRGGTKGKGNIEYFLLFRPVH